MIIFFLYQRNVTNDDFDTDDDFDSDDDFIDDSNAPSIDELRKISMELSEEGIISGNTTYYYHYHHFIKSNRYLLIKLKQLFILFYF